MGIFSRRKSYPSSNDMLLERLLALEQTRLEHQTSLQAKRDELEIRRLEIEMSNLDKRTNAQIELDKAREEIRKQRAERGRRGAARRWNRGQSVPSPGCPLCADPAYRPVTVEMVLAHRNHEAAAPSAAQPPPAGPLPTLQGGKVGAVEMFDPEKVN
jgi:hypothetical protein